MSGRFFDECRVSPLSVTECNEDSPEGELLRWITEGNALYERRKISQRTSMGIEQKAREGILPCKAPIGYLNYTMPDEKKIIVVDGTTGTFGEYLVNTDTSNSIATEWLEETAA